MAIPYNNFNPIEFSHQNAVIQKYKRDNSLWCLKRYKTKLEFVCESYFVRAVGVTVSFATVAMNFILTCSVWRQTQKKLIFMVMYNMLLQNGSCDHQRSTANKYEKYLVIVGRPTAIRTPCIHNT